MSQHSLKPIGIFDSGVGGLTVAKAVTNHLPQESIIYFGDTAHTPWGDKSAAAIQAYSIKICDMLLQQDCKLILIACNSASAVAHELVKEYVGRKSIVVDVIDPMIDYLAENYVNKTIGLIGTKQTICSNIYRKKLDQRDIHIQLNSLATPLLVPLIEEAADQTIMQDAIKSYLLNPVLAGLDALVLGCTHYPLIKQLIQQFYPTKAAILDSTDIVAKLVKNLLESHGLLSNGVFEPQKKFYVSDYTTAFSAHARLFFKGPVSLERYPLWE
ncbi:glutamate racemase [Candidatus Rickettsiella viridis]|nr:glutamate racemase [Candidatus Rickettsiella viridis]